MRAPQTGLWVSLAVDPAGWAHLAYEDETTHALRYATSAQLPTALTNPATA